MGRDAMKACENPCFRCRKEAAKYNDRLNSREGAAELLGVSVSSLADYELGITKVIPVDKVKRGYQRKDVPAGSYSRYP